MLSSLRNHHPDLALSNVLGSCTANILGSFSLGLIFARPDNPLAISDQDRSSARIYSALLASIAGLVVLIGPAWGMLLNSTEKGGDVGSAGRWAGILLLTMFALYVGGLVYGIQGGKVIAPEGSDSDTSDEESSEDEDEREGSSERGNLFPSSTGGGSTRL